jgi:hypothetical protein
MENFYLLGKKQFQNDSSLRGYSPVPFVKDDEVVMWCLECDTKLHLGERKITLIKKLIGNV